MGSLSCVTCMLLIPIVLLSRDINISLVSQLTKRWQKYITGSVNNLLIKLNNNTNAIILLI